MLSLFPSLLAWNQLSPFLIRLTLAAVFLVWSDKTFKSSGASSQDKGIAILEVIAGILLIIGHWTQGIAAFAILDLLVRISGKIKARQFLTSGVNYYLILLVLALSLILTGAGMFSSDLPL